MEIIVPLKYLLRFWITFEMPLINCEINLILLLSANCFSVTGTVTNEVQRFIVTNEKLYIPVVNLSTQDNVKLLEQLKSDFKRTVNWSK